MLGFLVNRPNRLPHIQREFLVIWRGEAFLARKGREVL